MSKKIDNTLSDELAHLGARGDEYKFLQGILSEMNMFRNQGNSKKFDQILKDLKSNDENLMLQALIELNQELNMTEETSLASMKQSNFIPTILNCLEFEISQDIMSNIF